MGYFQPEKYVHIEQEYCRGTAGVLQRHKSPVSTGPGRLQGCRMRGLAPSCTPLPYALILPDITCL